MDTFVKEMSWTKMVKAIECDDVDTVEKYVHVHGIRALTAHLLDLWCETCGHTNFTRYAVELASHAGSLNVFSMLIAHDLKLRSPRLQVQQEEYEDEQTPMFWLRDVLGVACRHGHVDIVRHLLNHCDQDSWVPKLRRELTEGLAYSLLSGNIELVREIRDLMLKQDMEFNITETAYKEGVRVTILLQLGMTVHEIEAGLAKFECPLPHRIIFLEQEVYRMKHITKWWKICDSDNRSVIDLVCLQGRVDILCELMKVVPSRSMKFPLRGFCLACKYSHCDMIVFLLDYNWRGFVNWVEVYESGIRECMNSRKMVPGKLVLGRLLDYKTRAAQVIKRKVKSALTKNDEEPLIRIPILQRIIATGTPYITELVVRSLPITKQTDRFFARDADIYHKWATFLLTSKAAIPDSNARANRLATVRRTCWFVCLVTFELLAAECLSDDELAEAIMSKMFDHLSSTAHWGGQSRTACLQRVGILCRAFQNSPELRVLLMEYISQIKDALQLYVLFDNGDFSDVFPRELKVVMDLSKRHSRRDIVRTLQSMCGWQCMVVRCDGLFEKSVRLPESEQMEMIDVIRQTGVRVHDALLPMGESSFDSINLPLSQPTSELVFQWYPELSLKALCRISIRRNLRLAFPVGSMNGLLLTLHSERILPRSLVEYLQFKEVSFFTTTKRTGTDSDTD